MSIIAFEMEKLKRAIAAGMPTGLAAIILQ